MHSWETDRNMLKRRVEINTPTRHSPETQPASRRNAGRAGSEWVAFLVGGTSVRCGEAEDNVSQSLGKFTHKPAIQQVLAAHRPSLHAGGEHQGLAWRAQHRCWLTWFPVVPTCPNPPSTPGPCQPLSHPLSAHSPCLHWASAWAPQMPPSPPTPLSDRIIAKIYVWFPCPHAALYASCVITWRVRFAEISLLGEKREHTALKQVTEVSQGLLLMLPSTWETELTIQSSAHSSEQMSPQPPLLKT